VQSRFSRPGPGCQAKGEALPIHEPFADAVTGTIGRRPSGARLYHRGSRFGEPEHRRLDRNLVARILFLAEALDRRKASLSRHARRELGRSSFSAFLSAT